MGNIKKDLIVLLKSRYSDLNAELKTKLKSVPSDTSYVEGQIAEINNIAARFEIQLKGK
jgi:hypothetical protein